MPVLISIRCLPIVDLLMVSNCCSNILVPLVASSPQSSREHCNHPQVSIGVICADRQSTLIIARQIERIYSSSWRLMKI